MLPGKLAASRRRLAAFPGMEVKEKGQGRGGEEWGGKGNDRNGEGRRGKAMEGKEWEERNGKDRKGISPVTFPGSG